MDPSYEPQQLSGIALDYRLDERGFETRQGLGIFLFTTASRPVLGPTPPLIQWVAEVLSLEIKKPRREAYHSPPSSPESRMRGAIIPLPQYAFMA
jgi:hypothetical protein